MKKILVMIGAGASKAHSQSACPPLGSELGKTLSERYKHFAKIEEDTGCKCTSDFESWTVSIGDNGEAYTDSLIITGHYFRGFDNIATDSLYRDLINSLNDFNTSYLSLNYECLLELALIGNNKKIDWGSKSYKEDKFNTTQTKTDEVTVLKPHGSSNFIATGKEIFNRGSVCTDISSKIYCETLIIHPSHHPDNDLVPVISAYEPEKRNSFNDDFIIEIRKKCLSKMSEVDTIIVIGIRHSPKDKFLPSLFDQMREHTDLFYIGGNIDFEGYSTQFKTEKRKVVHVSERLSRESISETVSLIKD